MPEIRHPRGLDDNELKWPDLGQKKRSLEDDESNETLKNEHSYNKSTVMRQKKRIAVQAIPVQVVAKEPITENSTLNVNERGVLSISGCDNTKPVRFRLPSGKSTLATDMNETYVPIGTNPMPILLQVQPCLPKVPVPQPKLVSFGITSDNVYDVPMPIDQKVVDEMKLKIRELEFANSELKQTIKRVFNDDQMKKLGGSSVEWSTDTVCEALKIRYACGESGYEYLRRKNYPLPAICIIDKYIGELKIPNTVLNECSELMKSRMPQAERSKGKMKLKHTEHADIVKNEDFY